MTLSFRFVAAFTIGACIAGQALADVGLIGNYEGKLKEVDGFSGHPGDTCTVTVSSSDLFGGAIIFDIANSVKLSVEKRRVESALEPGAPEAKWATPGGSTKPVEIVFVKLGDDGVMKALTLRLKYPVQHQEKSIVCSDLLPRK